MPVMKNPDFSVDSKVQAHFVYAVLLTLIQKHLTITVGELEAVELEVAKRKEWKRYIEWKP
jgi:hypothetical protein